MSGEELYAVMVEFATAHGWAREELGSGWWYRDREEERLGEAVTCCLEEEGIDLRQDPAAQAAPKESLHGR